MNGNNANEWATAGNAELLHPRGGGGGGGGGTLSAAAAAALISNVELVGNGNEKEEEKEEKFRGGSGASVASTAATVNSNDDGSIETDYVRHMYLMARSSCDDEENDGDADAHDLRDEEQRREQKKHPHIAKELCLFLKHRSWKKKLMTLVVVLSVSPVILDIFVFRSGHLQDIFDDYLDWMGMHPLFGPFSYICMLVLTSLIFIPPSILIFASGFTFSALYGRGGIIVALVSSYIGSTIGGAIGFVRARYMTRDLIEILIRRYPMIRAVDAAIVRNSLRVMILLRLNCLIPFGVLNYVFGITGVPWDAFVRGMVGIIPWHLFLVCLGASSATFVDTSGRGDDGDGIELLRLILSAMGVAFGFIGLAITWKFAKKELQKVGASVSEEKEHTGGGPPPSLPPSHPTIHSMFCAPCLPAKPMFLIIPPFHQFANIIFSGGRSHRDMECRGCRLACFGLFPHLDGRG